MNHPPNPPWFTGTDKSISESTSGAGRPTRGDGDAVSRFREAMQGRDHELLADSLAHDVVLFSPRSNEPVRGVRAVRALLWSAFETFAQLRYVGHFVGGTEMGDEETVRTHVLRFEARGVRGDMLDGVDILEINDAGLISTITVMLRPFENIAILKVLGRPARGPAFATHPE